MMKNDSVKTKEELYQEAMEGDFVSQFKLAEQYMEEKNDRLAFQWLLRSALWGNGEAYRLLGRIFLKSKNKDSTVIALDCFVRGALLRNSKAALEAGKKYYELKEYSLAGIYFRLAEDLGLQRAKKECDKLLNNLGEEEKKTKKTKSKKKEKKKSEPKYMNGKKDLESGYEKSIIKSLPESPLSKGQLEQQQTKELQEEIERLGQENKELKEKINNSERASVPQSGFFTLTRRPSIEEEIFVKCSDNTVTNLEYGH